MANEAQSYARQARGIVKVNNQPIAGWLEFTVTNNDFYEADTFSVTFLTSALPKAFSVNWFSQQTETFITLYAGFPKNPDAPTSSDPNMLQLVMGRVDDMDFDPVQKTLHLTGRDLTAVFIDNRVTSNYAPMTSSQIVRMLAKSHGIGDAVQTTTTPVATYYANDGMNIQANKSEWDLIAYLARQEGFVAYVGEQGLYFGDDPTDSTNPYLLTYLPSSSDNASPVANFESINLSRSQTVLKGITVTVMSAGRGGPTIKQSYPNAPKSITPGRSSPFGSTTNYYYRLTPGSSSIQCQQYAEQLYNQIIQHAVKLSVQKPGDIVANCQQIMKLSGTKTGWDQTYYPKTITRTLTFDGGFTMSIEAQNVSPNLSEAPPPGDAGSVADDSMDDDTDGS